MKYLVDANILSEPTKPAPNPAVTAWLLQNEREIAVDPVILGELRFGILLLPKGKKKSRLEMWFDRAPNVFNVFPGMRTPAFDGRSCSRRCEETAFPCLLRIVSSRQLRLPTASSWQPTTG